MTPINLGTGVLPDMDAEIQEAYSYEAILAGQDVYVDVNDDKVHLLSTAVPASSIRIAAIALNSAPTAGQPVKFQYGGRLKGTATVAVGTIYTASDTPGSVGPDADVATGDYVHILAVADTTTSVKLRPWVTNIKRA